MAYIIGQKVYDYPVRVGHVSVYIDGSGLYEAKASAVGAVLQAYSRSWLINELLEMHPESFKRSTRSKAPSYRTRDDRIALSAIHTFELAIIYCQL